VESCASPGRSSCGPGPPGGAKARLSRDVKLATNPQASLRPFRYPAGFNLLTMKLDGCLLSAKLYRPMAFETVLIGIYQKFPITQSLQQHLLSTLVLDRITNMFILQRSLPISQIRSLVAMALGSRSIRFCSCSFSRFFLVMRYSFILESKQQGSPTINMFRLLTADSAPRESPMINQLDT
jgi:hypothetical protein